MRDDDRKPDGRIFRPYVSQIPWRAAYGIELMRICREADLLSAKLGRFIPHVVPTEEEFKQILKSARRRKRAAEVPGGMTDDSHD